jgi:hypothetical protein
MRPDATPGATEIQVFSFLPMAPGTTVVRLVYRRPWLPDEAPARTFFLNVTVT